MGNTIKNDYEINSLRILKVYENSPLINLVNPYIDYLISIENGKYKLNEFNKIIWNELNELTLTIFDITKKKTRIVKYIPNRNQNNITGILTKPSNYIKDDNKILRIIENNNFKNIKFDKYDFILDILEYNYWNIDEFEKYIKIKKKATLIIFNLITENIRKIIVNLKDPDFLINKNIWGFVIGEGISNNIEYVTDQLKIDN